VSALDVRIRHMGSEDVPRALEIAESLGEAPHWTQDVYMNALDRASIPARIALVAEHLNAGVLGFLVTVMVPPQAELETIAVSKLAQRQGIGGRLFEELLRILKERQVTEVMLEVRESNHSARSFYGSLGFVQTGRRSGYYSDPNEDAILLHRPVA
jgi:ribosomal-protein-alanine acetyltransferase